MSDIKLTMNNVKLIGGRQHGKTAENNIFLQFRITELERRLGIAEQWLNQIADWEEGDVVNSTFDCPAHARMAREALAEINKEKEKR